MFFPSLRDRLRKRICVYFMLSAIVIILRPPRYGLHSAAPCHPLVSTQCVPGDRENESFRNCDHGLEEKLDPSWVLRERGCGLVY